MAGVRQAARVPRRQPRRAQQRGLETRDRLVAAALPVFAQRGFEGATTREIARRAGVALAALPYHFETKEALWRAAADRIFGLLAERFTALSAGLGDLDGRERAEALLRDFVRFAAEQPELHRFMLQEGTGPSPRLTWLVDTHVRPLYTAVCQMIEAARAQGVAVPGRPEHLYYAMIGAASMPYAMAPEFRLLAGSKPDAEALVAAHTELLLRLFFPETRSGR
jgi:TetR/AcrR family transcriptional regulator